MMQFANHCEMRLIFAVFLSICLFGGTARAIESVHLQMENDPSSPSIFTVSNVNYQLLPGNVIDFSCDVTVTEPLTHGTKILVNLSPGFPYAGLVDNMDFDMCYVSRKDMFLFRQLLNASNIPSSCPISPGVYSIRNFRLDLNRYPLALRGFDVVASFQVHNESRILSKFIARCALK